MTDIILNGFVNKGGPIVYILLLMSIISLTIIIYKIIYFFFSDIKNTNSIDQIHDLIRKDDIDQAREVISKSSNPCSDIILTVINTRQLSIDKVESEIAMKGELIIRNFSFLLKPLEIIANLSPLLGLLGTIIGMINAFANLEKAGSNIDPSILAGGIWQALITTALGLIVAIPSLGAFYWFDSKVDDLREKLRHAAIYSSNLLEKIK